MATLRPLLMRSRGQSLTTSIRNLNPVMRECAYYYRLTALSCPVEALDAWMQGRLRLILGLHWTRADTRARNLIRLGRVEWKAWKSATNGRGPWWNSGAFHINAALPKGVNDLSLTSLLDTMVWPQRQS